MRKIKSILLCLLILFLFVSCLGVVSQKSTVIYTFTDVHGRTITLNGSKSAWGRVLEDNTLGDSYVTYGYTYEPSSSSKGYSRTKELQLKLTGYESFSFYLKGNNIDSFMVYCNGELIEESSPYYYYDRVTVTGLNGKDSVISISVSYYDNRYASCYISFDTNQPYIPQEASKDYLDRVTFIDTNTEWEEFFDDEYSDGYRHFRSVSNYLIPSEIATMYITINKYTDFEMYIKSYSDSSDYVKVYELDSDDEIYCTSYNNSGKDVEDDYRLVKFSNLDGGVHRIRIDYYKNETLNYNDDRGYIAIPEKQKIWGEYLIGSKNGSGKRLFASKNNCWEKISKAGFNDSEYAMYVSNSRDNSIFYTELKGYEEFSFFVGVEGDANNDYIDISIVGTDGLFETTKGIKFNELKKVGDFFEVKLPVVSSDYTRVLITYHEDPDDSSPNNKGYILLPL